MAIRTIFTMLSAAGGLGSAYLADGAVTTDKLANDAVTSGKIADDAVGADAIASGAVGAGELAANAVTEGKIADGAVSGAKLADGASSQYYAVVAVTTDIDVTLNGAPNAPYGVSLGVGSLVLVLGQTDTSENGIYEVDTVGTGSDGVWSRPGSRDAAGELPEGLLVYDRNSDKLYKLTTAPTTLGTDPVIFEEQEEGLSVANGGEPEAVGTGDGSTLTFDLARANPVFVAVMVEGIMQSDAIFSVSGTGGAGGVGRITFSSGNAPPNGTQIQAIALYRS